MLDDRNRPRPEIHVHVTAGSNAALQGEIPWPHHPVVMDDHDLPSGKLT